MMKKITLLFIMLTAYFGYAQPTNNAPAPVKDAVDVISIYSGAYTDIATNYNPFWGQSGAVNTTYDPGTGDLVMAYTNFNYQGTELTTINAAGMEFLHVDLWTAADPGVSIIQVSPINNGTGVGEVLVTINHTAGTWTSVDIPKSSFTGMTWDSVFQLKIAANGAGSATPIDIYLDNIYFWKSALDPATDATLSDLQVEGATINGFASASTTYTYYLPTGTVSVPQITSATTTQAGASAIITQASGIPGSATVEVTSSDLSTTKTYTVNIVAVGPATAAPIQPARAVADVVSVFSDEYTNVTPSGVEVFGPSTYTNFTVENFEDTRRLTVGGNGQGMQYLYLGAAPLDLSSFTTMHIDFYVEGPVQASQELQIFLINFGAWPDGAGNTNLFKNFDVNAIGSGSWYSADFALDAFAGTPSSRDKVTLVQIVVNGGAGVPAFGPVYIDNIYFHKGTTLATKNFEIAGLNVYPNPAQDSWTVKTQNIKMSSIEVFDILGKNVISLKPETTEATINASQLKSGLYFAKINTANGSTSLKLVKE
jgi:hypothetical protein